MQVTEQVYVSPGAYRMCLSVSIQVRLQLHSCSGVQLMELLPDCVCPCAGEVVRGDSMQSDSSGYADEEFSPSSNVHGR